MKAYIYNCGITFAILSLVACNGGSPASEAAATVNASTPVNPDKPINGGHYHGGTRTNGPLEFNSPESNPVDSATPVGWNKSLNTLAPVNCWNYTAVLTNPSGSASIGDSQSISDFEQSQDTKVSLSAGFSIFSASNETSYSSMKALDKNSISAFNSANAAYILRVSISGLNDYGQMILNNQPMNFAKICGDSVINDAPIKIQSGVNIVFTSSVSTAVEDMSAAISAGVGFAELSVAIKDQKKNTDSNSTVTYHQFDYGDPTLFPDLSNDANDALTNCISNGDATSCNTFMTNFANSFTQSLTKSRDAFERKNGTGWGSIYALDNANFSQNLKLSSSINYLSSGQKIQLSGLQKNSLLTPYLSSIQHNFDVLADLDTAKTIFKKVVANYSSKKYSHFIYFFNREIILSDYNRSINLANDNLYKMLGQCIYSKSAEDAKNNCSVLDEHSTVAQFISGAINPLSKENWYYPELYGLILTVNAMIYDVTQSGNPQAMVFIPEDAYGLEYTNPHSFKYLANWSWFNFDLNHNTNNDVKLEVGAFIATNSPGVPGVTNLFDYDSSNNKFFEYTPFDLIPNVPGQDINCNIFKSTSQGCSWTVTKTSSLEGSVVIKPVFIKDNSYRGVFKTLYPFN